MLIDAADAGVQDTGRSVAEPALENSSPGCEAAAMSEKKKEIYTYEAPWLVYGMNWSVRRGGSEFRLAIGSFLEEYRSVFMPLD